MTNPVRLSASGHASRNRFRSSVSVVLWCAKEAFALASSIMNGAPLLGLMASSISNSTRSICGRGGAVGRIVSKALWVLSASLRHGGKIAFPPRASLTRSPAAIWRLASAISSSNRPVTRLRNSETRFRSVSSARRYSSIATTRARISATMLIKPWFASIPGKNAGGSVAVEWLVTCGAGGGLAVMLAVVSHAARVSR